MGILRDLVEGGFLTFHECLEEFEDWYAEGGYGYLMRHYGEVEQIQNMIFDMLDKGFDQFAETLLEDFFEAIDFYEAKYEYEIYYNPQDKHWHDSVTHRYVSDPYEWIRD